MIAELRAANDRLTHAGAYLRYLVSQLRPNEPDRQCRATGLTVRQTVAHIVLWLESQAGRCAAFAAHSPPLAQATDIDEMNRLFAESESDTPLPELLARYDSARATLARCYEQITPEMAESRVGDSTAGDVLLDWTGHPERHALDFAEALPRLRFDPLLLDWALHAELSEPSDLQRQLKLAEAARDHLRSREATDGS